MAEVLTAAQMRRIEQMAIDGGQVTGLELMERAGQGVVDAMFGRWPTLKRAGVSGGAKSVGQNPPQAVVLCGPGNNGGDGFVIARLLHHHGWNVAVYLLGDPSRLPVDALENYSRWCTVGPVKTAQELLETCAGAGLAGGVFVDALFGTGLTRAVPQNLAQFLDQTTKAGSVRTVAVDIPSGLCADSGRMLQPVSTDQSVPVSAFDLTVTFHRAKRGHLSQDGAQTCGKLAIVDIGLDKAHSEFARNHAGPSTAQETLGCIARWIEKPGLEGPDFGVPAVPELSKTTGGHKFSHGHALMFAGAAGKTGAARLAARGALRVGAGLVTIAVPDCALSEVAAQVTAIMVTPVHSPDDVTNLLADHRINALCIGPGSGLEPARSLVSVALNPTACGARCAVLDADALTAFAPAPDDLFALLDRTCVLTPHFGEFARLFPDLAEKLRARPVHGPSYGRFDAVRDAAARAGCVVLLKGPDTVIADPEGKLSVNAALYENQAPWLATAGSGDVLAGFITGLLARGFPALQAAETGAWLHAQCGRSYGPGLIAEDLPEEVPKVLRSLLP